MCPICEASLLPYLTVRVLAKYDVQYYRCHDCSFITTEKPYWLDEAYAHVMTSLDVGLVHRNLNLAPITEAVIRKWFQPKASFLDYGGGYGLFVRLMRDRGFNFYWQDPHCENLFAKQFSSLQNNVPDTYELITCFEVLEHVHDPVATVRDLLNKGKQLLFTTELQPYDHVTPDNWWYFIPETGQHISLYSRRSLLKLAERLNVSFYTNGRDIHLLTSQKVSNWWLTNLLRPRCAALYNLLMPGKQVSLLEKDFTILAQHSSASV